MSTSLMASALRRHLAGRPGGAFAIGRRSLGDSTRGPPLNNLPANLKIATEFFQNNAVSYAEYKQQCVSLRLFAFAAVSVGCFMSLIVSPPKSSYWANFGPVGWFSYVKSCFSNGDKSLFLTERSSPVDAGAILTSNGSPDETGVIVSRARAAPAAPAAPAPTKNAAFVFVKPHAVTPAACKMVKDGLEKAGLTVLSEGVLTSEEIDEKKLIDQHYYAIASKATILKPKELNIPTDKFKAFFGQEWEDALKTEKVFNALDACKEFGCNADELSKAWADTKTAGKLIKFGGGFYCGLVQMNEKELYVFNAFFMTMRSAFTAPGKSIHYYTVEWDEDKLSWEDFRGKLLGPTDPADAPSDSLRGEMLKKWFALGLPGKPNTGDNGVHASASPFEATAERLNWLGAQCKADSFCKAMLDAGVKETTIKAWSVDPQVKIEAGGKKGSIFDALEDMNAAACIAKCKELEAMQ